MEKPDRTPHHDGARRSAQVPRQAGAITASVRVEPEPCSSRAISEAELRQAERKVCEAEAATERQRMQVFELRRNGKDTKDAEILLRACQSIVLEHRKYLAMQQIRYRRSSKAQSRGDAEALSNSEGRYLGVGK